MFYMLQYVYPVRVWGVMPKRKAQTGILLS